MNSTGDDLVEAPEDFFGNSIEPLDVHERSLRGGSWARSCSHHPRRRPRESELLGQSVHFWWTWPPAGIDVGLGDVVSGVHVAMQAAAEVVRVSS